MGRAHQIVLIISAVLGSWFGMQAVHELGHVLCAWATGATVTGVFLDPFSFSRTDVTGGRYSLVVVWGGPLLGAGLPLLTWLGGVKVKFNGSYLLRFFTGFCLVANGLYVGIGSFERAGDPGDMLRLGTPVWLLWAFGAAAVPAGLRIWHNLGSAFGLGPGAVAVSRRAAYGCLAVVLGWVVGMGLLYRHF